MPLRTLLARGFRWLAALRLAVLLILILAAVLAWATVLESGGGREYAQWHVYKSPWFLALLAMLAANILAATLIRFPWKRSQIGFVVTHAGILVLLAGSIQTFLAGIDGQLAIEEGQVSDSILLTGRSQFTAFWHRNDPRPPAAFIFGAGPTKWPEGKTLDLGGLSGVQLRVMKFFRHARTDVEWVEDEFASGGPVLQFSLLDSGGRTITTSWLVAEQFGAEAHVGPAKFELQRAATDTLIEDFLASASRQTDERGMLSIHWDGHRQLVPVSENIGKEIAVGKSEIVVKIREYLPSAKPDISGRFTSEGDAPENPLLELQVKLPDREEPLRQIAFAKHPMLSLDAIHGWNCPVKFWYHHPAITPEPGAEFLQTSDGKLHCRVLRDGTLHGYREVQAGDEFETAARFRLRVLTHLPSARKEIHFRPVEPARGERNGPEAAALLEVVAGGKRQQVWLKRNDATYGIQTLDTPEGALAVSFGYEELPLGFSLKLVDFKRRRNPGGMGDASFASTIRLIDTDENINKEHEISMNEPLVHGKFTFYQSGFHELPGGRAAAVLTVAYDPGRFMKYLGSLMICGGVFVMFYSRRLRFKKKPRSLLRHGSRDGGGVREENQNDTSGLETDPEPRRKRTNRYARAVG